MVYLKNEIFIEERVWDNNKIYNSYYAMKADYTENGTMSSLYTILHLILIIHNIIQNTFTDQEIEAESGQLTCLISNSFLLLRPICDFLLCPSP